MSTIWHQHTIEFTDRDTAEHVAAHHIRPALTAAQNGDHIQRWWYIRKNPTWRLRYRAHSDARIAGLLDVLVADHRVVGVTSGMYEPETHAFGGTEAMEIAHELFHHDSRHILNRAASSTAHALGRRETSTVLCSVLLRSAGLDWYEQGDVWDKVAELRPAAPTDADHRSQWATTLVRAMHRLMAADARTLCDPLNGPLAGLDGWVAAFELAGQALADLARHGLLTRGLRAVLAHHIIFHANRAGLTLTDQSTLAALAVANVFGTHKPVPTTEEVNNVTPVDTSPDADALRNALTDRLRARNTIRTPGVEAAFRHVPRDLFLPDIPLDDAYANSPVYTKTDAAGASISAASQPGIVAMMLEQLDAQPGDRILEAGAGTGYNAALLGSIVGDTGHVTSLDVDEDLVEGAQKHLAAAGIDNVDVLLRDGALGHPFGGPYDRIIATVGAFEVPTAWLDQLSPHGRLVVPLRLRGAASRSIIFERGPGGWHSIGSELAVFMPLRGIADDYRRVVPLTAGEDVVLNVHKDNPVDAAALKGVLDTERHEVWTGVLFAPMQSYEWMDLFLSCRLDNPLIRMPVLPAAVDRGAVDPMFGWGAMATTHGADLAYLTIRPATLGRRHQALRSRSHRPRPRRPRPTRRAAHRHLERRVPRPHRPVRDARHPIS